MEKNRLLVAIAACSFQLPQLEDGSAWIQVTPAGEFRPTDGRPMDVPAWRIDAASAAAVIDRARARKTPPVLDYEHQTLKKEENGQPAPAAGRFLDFEWREGSGLWGRVEYTARAARMIEDGEYLYFSPVFSYLKPLGTMAHEWLMAHQQLGPRLIDSQSAALDCWVREYRGLLGIALTDCITTDAFLRDFDLYFAKLFDGLRHDSGDPLLWAEKTIAHYLKLGIDPLTKTLVFSDGLDLPRALKIYRALQGRINVSFGIGTHFTCDLPGVEPMNIVVKMSACNGHPVAKISDTPGKAQCRDPDFIHYLKHVFQVA